MKKIITKILTAAAIICIMFTLMLCHAHAIKPHLQYYNTDFKQASVASRNIVAAAKAQIGKTTKDLYYNVNWTTYFVGDAARLAGIPKEIIPDEASPDILYKTLVNDLGAKKVTSREIQPGDLIFYRDYNKTIYSVGIMINKTEMIMGNIYDPEIGSGMGGVYQKEAVNLHMTFANRESVVLILRPNYKLMNQKFTITFKADGAANVPKKITKKYGEAPKIPDTVPKKDGHYFLGWATAPGGEIKYLPGASLKLNENISLYAIWSKTAPIRYDAPLGGGNRVFTADEIMYPGDPGTAFHNAIAKPDVWSPTIGGYESFFGVKTERAEYLGLDCVKVSLLDGYTQGYFDFNYYQYDCGYYQPSLDGSKARWLKIKYSYNAPASSIKTMKVFGSKDVYPQGEALQNATNINTIENNYGKWNEAIIYLGDTVFSDGTKWHENTMRQFRIHLFEGNKAANAECYIAGFGFFSTRSEAVAFDPGTKASGTVIPDTPATFSAPTPGGKALFSVDDMMYEGDPGTQFHNAFAKSDIVNPLTGKYEKYFGIDMERTTYLDRDCVKISLLDGYTQGYLDFNYYQWNADHYNPSLDGSKYRYLVVNYTYRKSEYAPKYIQFYASKDMVPLSVSDLKTATINEKLDYKSGEWNQAIFDLKDLQFSDGTKWQNNTIRQWRIYPFMGNDDPNARMYISSIGFFETEEEARGWDGSVE